MRVVILTILISLNQQNFQDLQDVSDFLKPKIEVKQKPIHKKKRTIKTIKLRLT